MKRNRLVQFTKHENDDHRNKVIDVQYHLFLNCDEFLSFIYDPIFKKFTEKGYYWSAIDFMPVWADLIGFTSSECEG